MTTEKTRLIKVRIHKDYYDFINQFGGLSVVAKTMVDLVYDGLIEPDDMYKCPLGDNSCISTSASINVERYAELVKLYGVSSPRISIRRYLYYFVDNEIYNLFPEYFKFTKPKEDKRKTVTLSNLLRR